MQHLSEPNSHGHLPRNLTSLETFGFGLSGHLSWINTAPVMHMALGPQAIFVWLPAVIIGMMLNFQVKQLGTLWSDVSGGTPNYTTRLLQQHPNFGRYAAIAYYFSWAIVPALNAINLTDLIKANLLPLGIPCPELALKIGFTIVPFIVAFSGTRTLGILHAFFVLPAIGLLLLFCMQGMGWLAIAPTSPGVVPTSWSHFSFVEWAKWFFFAVYGTYACETGSSFVADSKKPTETLRFIAFSAWLIPIIYLGGSWVLMQVGDTSTDTIFSHLLSASQPFWGAGASLFVTLLLTSSCLLISATAVASAPRVLYQLAVDQQLSPVFSTVSRDGVLAPNLIFTLAISILFLEWGDVSRIVVVGSTAYMVPMMALHWGLWLHRNSPEARFWSRWSLGFLCVEAVVLLVGGLAWSWEDVLIGLFAAVAILGVDAAIRRTQCALFQPEWWMHPRLTRAIDGKFKDFVTVQVIVLIVLVCSATTIGWMLSKLGRGSAGLSNNLLVTVLMMIAFVAIAIACWTSLPQVAAIAQARERAENLFITALDTVPDTILVLNEAGTIVQANSAATPLLQTSPQHLAGQSLSDFFPSLDCSLESWAGRSEQTLIYSNQGDRIIELTLSQRCKRNFENYIVILRDVTEQKQADTALRQSEALLRQKTQDLEQALSELQQTQSQLIQTEKMSSLGQLVAGVAHEINNPVNFIHGNLTYVSEYSQNLLKLITLFQTSYPTLTPSIQRLIDEIDLDFIAEDLSKTLASMKGGADRIREIVLTLRNFSRLDEAGMKPANIHEGIDSTLLILQNRLKAMSNQSAIQIVKQYDNLPQVECYAGQLNQVFMNLISNAIDVLRQRDEQRSQTLKEHSSIITISTQRLGDEEVAICIKDNGPGIPESIQRKLFDPFFTTKPVGQGTGLGLSISYQIVVDKHSGTINCCSAPGQGAEFWIRIPVTQTLKNRHVQLIA
ncbi:MAG: amino acid permease [Myxacorys californica WJT36-NPBG1]|nr:amino acid permease [Myxacorys californica WJT36-NPBG1]